jgi:hypothetical protein
MDRQKAHQIPGGCPHRAAGAHRQNIPARIHRIFLRKPPKPGKMIEVVSIFQRFRRQPGENLIPCGKAYHIPGKKRKRRTAFPVHNFLFLCLQFVYIETLTTVFRGGTLTLALRMNEC